jgi:PAS domain S-box-containing protein
MDPAPIQPAGDGLGRRIQVQLQRFGQHPGGSWSLAWIALFAGGVWLDPSTSPVARVAASVLTASFVGFTWVGALAFAGRRAPLWILPAAAGLGVARGVVTVAGGPAAGDLFALLYEPGAVLAAAVVVWGAELLDDERGLRTALVASLFAVAALEVADGLWHVIPAVPEPRAAWYAVVPFAAFFEVSAMWAWIARRELRIERAEDGQRRLESAVERERRTNDLLRRKEAWLFDFFETAPDLLLVLAPDTSEILRCNRRFSEALGRPRRELVGRSLVDLLVPETVGHVQSILRARRRRVRNLMLHLLRHDDSELIVLANLAVRSDPDGDDEVRGVLHDVTRLERAAGADLQRVVAEHAGAALFHADERGRCAQVNASFCELTGLSPGAAREQSWLRVVHPDDRHRVEQAWDDSVHRRVAFQAEHRLRGVAGPTLRVVTECVPLPDEEGGGFAGSMARVSASRRPASLGAVRRARDAVRQDGPAS